MSLTGADSEADSCKDLPSYPKSDLVEQDYIGLSGSSLLIASQSTQLDCSSAPHQLKTKVHELQREDTELRLGIGTVYSGNGSPLSHAFSDASPSVSLEAFGQIRKHDGTGLRACSGNGGIPVRVAMDVEEGFDSSMVSGKYRIPSSKTSSSSSKRPFTELGGNRECNDELPVSDPSTKPLSKPAGSQLFADTESLHKGIPSWSNCSSRINLATRPEVSAAHVKSSIPIRRHLPLASSIFKAPSISTTIPYSSQIALSPSPTSMFRSDGMVSVTCQDDHDDVRKAPVVGWPPVRSFRRSALLSANPSTIGKAGNTYSDLPNHKDASLNTLAGGGETSKVSSKENLFIKVKLDGVRICRKVDVTAHDNYESLKSALQHMFQGFVFNDNLQLDLLQGEHYVLTHEDKDGDCMLVGDVPWRMFVSTVKSLRIMRAADAVGLGKRSQQLNM